MTNREIRVDGKVHPEDGDPVRRAAWSAIGAGKKILPHVPAAWRAEFLDALLELEMSLIKKGQPHV